MTIVAGGHRKLYMTRKFGKEIFVRKISEEFVTTKKKGKCLTTILLLSNNNKESARENCNI